MEGRRRSGNKLQLLSQALSAASHSLNLAKQLINEIERSGGSLERPGLIGKYDGTFMVTEAGKKYPVPDNYAAKTKLVYGDKLKMVEGHEGRRFKYVGRVPHVEVEATLRAKDGQLVAVTPKGSYRLIQSGVKFFNGQEGDKARILLPRDEKHAPFAAIAGVVGKGPEKGEPRPPSRDRDRRPAAEGSGKKEDQPKPAKVEEKKEAVEKEKPAEAPKLSPAKSEAKSAPGGEVPAEGAVEAKPAVKKKPAAKPSKASPAKGGKPVKKATAKKAVAKKAPAKKRELKIEPPGEEELV